MSQSPYLTDHATDKDLLRYEDFQAAFHEIVTEAETPLTVGGDGLLADYLNKRARYALLARL